MIGPNVLMIHDIEKRNQEVTIYAGVDYDLQAGRVNASAAR